MKHLKACLSGATISWEELHIFFHPDYNRWSRSSTGSATKKWVADYTASGESHPALKTLFICF